MTDAEAFLRERKRATEERFKRVQERTRPLEPLLDDVATVYATGSFGRGEASQYSDLDVFILSNADGNGKPLLTDARTIRVQAGLIEAAEEERFPPFSDDAVYLKRHTVWDMVEKLGGREDDYENLFTARMLLLLESRPLLGAAMYDHAIDRVLSEYWKDFARHEEEFQPIYLANDLIRYWKVLCLNYEANTRHSEREAKRRLLNYKLKHSRLLTCYSAILYFCHLLRSQSAITLEDAKRMTRLTPTDRLMVIKEDPAAAPLVDEILATYVGFLQSTEAPKQQLLRDFGDLTQRRSGQHLGELVYKLLRQIGEQTTLFRYLVV